MPVPGGYGGSTLDYIGCCRGHGFAIEAKAPKKKPTLKQQQIIEKMMLASMKVFVINSYEGIDELNHWLNTTSSGADE
jgi:penicillin-binding protein-related factor A (putative recombinase)